MPILTTVLTRLRGPTRLTAMAALAFLTAGRDARGQGYFSMVVAKTGDVAPGTGGLLFGVPPTATDPAGFGVAVINSDGASAFLARVTGPGVTGNVNDIGSFYRTNSGTLSLLARLGDEAPGTGGAVFAADSGSGNGLGFTSIGAGGGVGFRGFLAGSGVTTANDIALFSGPPGQVQLLAREGSEAGGTGGATFTSFSDVQIRADNSIFFQSGLAGAGVTTANNSALFAGTPGTGNVSVLVRKGDVAAGTGGARFADVSGFFVTNPTGTFVFRGALVQGGSVTTANDTGVFGGTAGNLNPVLREGDVAPGIGTAVMGFNAPAVLADGRFVLNATAAVGGTVTDANNAGLYVGTAGNLNLVAREGDQVSNAPAGVQFGGFGIPIASAGSSAFAFRSAVVGAGVTTTNNRAIFGFTDVTGVRLVARQGDTAPGTGGASYGAFGTLDSGGGTQLVTVGPTGATAFYSPLTGTGVTTANDRAIFVDTPGGVVLVVREGDEIDLDPGLGIDLATVRSLALIDTLLGNQAGFSAVGSDLQIAYSAEFTDGRSASLIAVVPVPEPGLIVGAAAAGLAVLVRVRRRRAV